MTSPSPAGVLRMTDWRHLFAEPTGGRYRHLVLAGATEDIASRVQAAGVADRVSVSLPEGASADAVVVLGEAGVDIDVAARSVAEGGVLYFEVDRSARGSRWMSPARAERAVRAAGLKPAGQYWVRPDFRCRQLYVPIDRPGPIIWYLRTMFIAHRLRDRVLGTLLPVLWSLHRAAATTLIRRFAITATAVTEERPIAILAMRGMPDHLRDPAARPVVVTNGRDDLNRIVLLPFGPHDKVPRAVIKLPRLGYRNPLYEQEHEALSTLRTLIDADLAEALPNPLAKLRWHDLTVGVESYVPGRSLARNTRWPGSRRRRLRDFQIATTWLTEFNLQAQVSRGAWTESDQQRWVEEPIRAYETACELSTKEGELFDMVRHQTRALIGRPFPIVWQHYAFASWNLARDGHQLRVFDWEGASPGLPLFDLLYLTINWYAEVDAAHDEAARLRSFRALFCEPSDPASIARHLNNVVTEYLRRLGVDAQFRAAGLVLFCLYRALSALDRESAAGALPTPAIAIARGSYLKLLANHADTLCPSPRGSDARRPRPSAPDILNPTMSQ